MKRIFLFFPLLSLAGCYVYHYPDPVATRAPANNSDYKVAYLFEHEGCKVYRFYDYGNTVYFTNCNGDTVAFGDSTQVRSTGSLKVKPAGLSPLAEAGNSGTLKNKPLDVSSFMQGKSSQPVKIKSAGFSSLKEKR